MGRRGSSLSHLLKENRSYLPLSLSGRILCVFSAFHSLSGMGFLTWAAAGLRMEPGTAWDCGPGCSQGFCRARGGSDPHLSPEEGQPKTRARLSGLIFLPQQWQLVSPLCLPLPCLTTSLRLRCQPNGKSSKSVGNNQPRKTLLGSRFGTSLLVPAGELTNTTFPCPVGAS